MNSDFKDLLRTLLEKNVEFLIVGGYAVIRYTEPRYTKDLDLLIGSNRENARKVHLALTDFGAAMSGISEEDLSTPGVFFQIGVPPNRVDIIVTIPGIDFADAYKRRETVVMDDLELPFIAPDDLISAKLASGRPQDLVDAGAIAKSRMKFSSSGNK